MLSQKNQVIDICFQLQISQVRPIFEFVGDSAGLKTFKNPVLTISDLHFTHFSDMSMGHKIKITIIIKILLDLSIGYL